MKEAKVPQPYKLYCREGLAVICPDYSGVRKSTTYLHDLTKEKNSVKGKLSKVSKSKMRYAISNLLFASKTKQSYNPKYKSWYNWKLNFVTLTLPAQQNFTDAYFRRHLLNNFLVDICRKYQPTGYVWKLEAQSNGNIHCHILFDCYIDYSALVNTWNRILSKTTLITDYQALHGHNSPNSTDVHSLSGITNVVAYITEYFSKGEEGKRAIVGKLWGCSDNLKGKFNTYLYPSDFDAIKQHIDQGDITDVTPDDLKEHGIEILLFHGISVPEFLTKYHPRQYYEFLENIISHPPHLETG